MNIIKSIGLGGLLVSLVLAAPTQEWRADLSGVAFPAQPATGRIRGQAFSLEKANFRAGFLKLRQGKDFVADREVTIILSGGKNPSGLTIEVSPQSGFYSRHVQGVTISSKETPGGMPKTEMFNGSGKDLYVMRLKFGALAGGKLPGQIYLCTMDAKKSFVAGSFLAEVK